MKVAELLLRLKDAEPDAVVLLLPRYADFTEAEEIADVALIAEPWTCERHRNADGTTTEVHHPTADGYTLGWSPATDEEWSERVIILSPQPGTVEARLTGDAGAASDNRALTDSIREQALQTRRGMLADGTLLPEDELRARLGISKKRFARMLEDGSVFGLDVDGTVCFPALLTDSRLDSKRLQAICRIIAPARAGSRLDFLSSPHGALGDRSPLQMLDDDSDYKQLCEVAETWVAQSSRTTVRLYEGEHGTEPDDVAPLYTAIAEIDPRKPLWTRASKALHDRGYEWPLGPYPEVRTFTMFVEQQAAGYGEPRAEACVQITANGDLLRVRIIHKKGTAWQSQTVSAGKRKSFVDVAKRVIAHLLRSR
ncbi:hypothetical protein [Paraburkholderia youngii]|uniref:hypothetical protein n=1 Tax=Paraburkholderia youngii TaxID=2782701 RepID=UPI003D233B10